MNITKEELQDKLKNLKALRTVGQICIDKANESHIKDDAGMAKSIAEIEQAIAEESKPKLRQYDMFSDGRSQIVITKHSADKWAFNYSTGSLFIGYTDDILDRIRGCKYVYIGNVMDHFDDLTALSEDVESFELGNKKVWAGDRGVMIKDLDDLERVSILHEDLPAFILGIRQIIATLQRKEASK